MCVHVNRNVPLALYDCVFDLHSDTAAADDDAFFNLNTFVCFFSSLSPLFLISNETDIKNKKNKNKSKEVRRKRERTESSSNIPFCAGWKE